MKRDKRFYPDYLAEILFIVFLAIEVTVILALVYPQQIGRQIDFTAQFQPKPEWYFLWLYQLLRYFPGDTAFIGTVVIPAGAALLLLGIPYLDKGRRGRLRAFIAGIVLLLAFLVFTLVPALSQ